MDVFGWIGTALALFFFISPVTLMWGLIKKTVDINNIPWILLIANTGNCILWAAYGFLLDKTQVWVCNSIGSVINVIYMCIYFIHLVNKKPLESVGVVVLTIGIPAGIFFLFYQFVSDDVTGKVAMVFNIIMYAAPSQKIVRI
jgi:hypothetical protein